MTDIPVDIGLIERLRDEAALCRSETAVDIAELLEEAVDALTKAYQTNDGISAEYVKARLALQDAQHALTAKDEHAAAMRKAVLQAIEVIQGWHNMGMSGKVASDTWDIYWRNAPEMKPIREALKEA